WLGWVDRPRLRELLAEVDIGLVTFLPAPNHMEAYPGKLFEYMAAGLPVIASDFPLWREIVSEVACGLLVDPADPAAIAAAIDTLLSDPAAAVEMGRRGREAVLERYNWEAQMPALLDLYEAVMR
ncbi:MAG: glycosyltransferase family 4 protein, partial [Actinobacteria bacterium]